MCARTATTDRFVWEECGADNGQAHSPGDEWFHSRAGPRNCSGETLSVLPVGEATRRHVRCGPVDLGGRIMDFNAVAHDLRTPLNVMLGHMQLLAVERLSDTGRQRLAILGRQIRRMMRLLDRCTDP